MLTQVQRFWSRDRAHAYSTVEVPAARCRGSLYRLPMSGNVDDAGLMALCEGVVDAVEAALGAVEDWTRRTSRPGQYVVDLVADRAALGVLAGEGVGVLSEESGIHGAGSAVMAVLDPLDGSTNASRRLPWYATSICMVDAEGPRVSLVANLASGVRYRAIRGSGAWRDGARITASGCSSLQSAIVALSGFPPRRAPWAQFRALGAAALDLCSVADGTLDAFAVVGESSLGAWDYLGGLLICTEAGASVAEMAGRDLVDLDQERRRAPVAAATARLLAELMSQYDSTAI